MKHTFTLAAAICGAALLFPSAGRAAEDIAVDETHFPDPNFRTYVAEKIDTNADGVLSANEVEAATCVDVSGKGIASLAGIEYLSGTQTLVCSDNRLTELDVRGNSSLVTLYCSGNQLVALDLSQNTKLETLDCQDNEAKFADKIVGGKSYVPVSSLEARGFDVNRVDPSLLVYVNGVECVCLGECPSADTELSLSYKYDTGNSNVANPTFTISRIVGGGTDGVNALTGNAEPATEDFYTTGGVKTSGLKKGLNIVRFADGSCKKVMVK